MDLSSMELAILGTVWKRSPCTAYAVQREFAESPSSHWSGSAGAVYPAVGRLEERGLIAAKLRRTGERRSQVYSPTPRGEEVLRDWLRSEVSAQEADYAYDPVRLRVFFLDALDDGDARQVLQQALARSRDALEHARRYSEQASAARDRLGEWASRGAEYALEARIRWLAELLEALDEG